jgi:MraZ protein
VQKVINNVVNCGKKWYIFVSDSKEPSNVKNLIGMYECKVDAKGRLMLPSGLKKQLAAELQEGFVLKRSVFNTCLELHTLKEWNGVMAEVNQLNRFVKKNNDFIRRFTAGVRMVEADATARIQIPRDLINFAGIEKQLVLASVGNIVEVWDKVQYEKVVNDSEVDFGALAEEVMGNPSKTAADD